MPISVNGTEAVESDEVESVKPEAVEYTSYPVAEPTMEPTFNPWRTYGTVLTAEPTMVPTFQPTFEPTVEATVKVTFEPCLDSSSMELMHVYAPVGFNEIQLNTDSLKSCEKFPDFKTEMKLIKSITSPEQSASPEKKSASEMTVEEHRAFYLAHFAKKPTATATEESSESKTGSLRRS